MERWRTTEKDQFTIFSSKEPRLISHFLPSIVATSDRFISSKKQQSLENKETFLPIQSSNKFSSSSCFNSSTGILTTAGSAISSGISANATSCSSSSASITSIPPPVGGKRPRKTNSEKSKQYRAKRKKYVDTLCSSVQSLREEVNYLQQLLNGKRINQRSSSIGSLAQIAEEYIRLFQFGLNTNSEVVQSVPSNSLVSSSKAILPSVQEDFLRCTFDPNFQFSDFSGAKLLMEQWKRYTSFHENLEFIFQDLTISGDEEAPVVTANALLKVVITRKTIEHIFPNIRGNEALIQQLIGKKVVYHSANLFKFTKDGKVARFDALIDFLPSLAKTFGLEKALLMCQNAMIKDSSVLVDAQNEEEPTARFEVIEEKQDELPHGQELQEQTGVKEAPKLSLEFILS